MAHNTGYKVFTLLQQVSNLTNLPTGVQKPNVPSDINYIAPVLDLVMCAIGGGANTMSIEVAISAVLTANIKISFGAVDLIRNSSGIWVVPLRVYDNISLTVSNFPYEYIITYNNGLVKKGIIISSGQLFISGPYPAIAKIEIISALGSFNNDFNPDYKI